MGDLLLEGNSLSFSYSNSPVFEDLNIEVKAGEAVILLGANGCGKSTLLRLLAGLNGPAAGEVLLKGKRLSRYSVRERSKVVAWLPQKDAPGFSFPVANFLYGGLNPHLGLLERPDPIMIKTVESAATACGISHLLMRNTDQLSGGESRLMWIARALVQQAQLLIMDEPASHLDPAKVQKVLRLVSEQVRGGRSALLSLHDPNHLMLLVESEVPCRLYGFTGSGFREISLQGCADESEWLFEIYNTPLELFSNGGRIRFSL